MEAALSRARLKLTLCQARAEARVACVYTRRACVAEANGNFPPAVMAERGMRLTLIVSNPQRRRATSVPHRREAKSSRWCIVAPRRYNSLAERVSDGCFACGWIAELEPVQTSFTTAVKGDAMPSHHQGHGKLSVPCEKYQFGDKRSRLGSFNCESLIKSNCRRRLGRRQILFPQTCGLWEEVEMSFSTSSGKSPT